MSAMWISRYSNPELKSGKYYPVGISIGKPKWPLGYDVYEQCYSLAPKGYMLNMDLERFKPAYFEKLEAIGTDKIISMVERMYNTAEKMGKEVVFLCYEDVRVPGEWCHRTVFAEWWAQNMGEIIEELPDPTEPKVKIRKSASQQVAKPAEQKKTTESPEANRAEYRQMSLFDLKIGDAYIR